MKARTTWILAALAAVLFAFIFLVERHTRQTGEVTPPGRILPQLNATTVTCIQVRPAGQLEIRVEHTNDGWQLTQPVSYPAQAACVEDLLHALEKLAGQAHISAEDLRGRPDADKEFGFDAPRFSLIIRQGGVRQQILIGAPTALKDQVFLQVVGTMGMFLVDAALLQFIPNHVNEWRDTRFINLKRLAFDRLAVTNGAKVFELQRDGTNQQWRMTHPLPARADNPKIENLLQRLQDVRVSQFVSDNLKTDLDVFGLQPPEWELALRQGTNTLALLQFGRNSTNDPSQLYLRRPDRNTIVLVPQEPLAPWRVSYTEFRDRHLVAVVPGSVDVLEIRGTENFTLQFVTNQAWRVVGLETFPVDSGLVNEFIGGLCTMEVVEFVKDVVTPLDLATYGLAPPARQFLLKSGRPNGAPGPTNTILAALDLGASQGDRVFARRADNLAIDGNSVYAMNLADCQRLPSSSWQFRDRRIWNFTESEVVRLTIHYNGRVRELLRTSTNQWAFAPGSQGVINEFAVEETVHRLGELSAVRWVDRGSQNRARYGFSENSHRLSIETKQGGKWNLEFGTAVVTGSPSACVSVEGQDWFFEFPWALYQYVQSYLTIPANVP